MAALDGCSLSRTVRVRNMQKIVFGRETEAGKPLACGVDVESVDSLMAAATGVLIT